MSKLRIGEVAHILGVSVDTVRRYIDAGELRCTRSAGQQRLIEGEELARFLERASEEGGPSAVSSARNHLFGIVTKVVKDKVSAQVEMRCGPYRVVSLLTRESVESLGLKRGVLVNAVIKATNVVVERAGEGAGR
ncbi:MAG: helix-turn-helix transcriptional regulator [Planctomycetota bacterium]